MASSSPPSSPAIATPVSTAREIDRFRLSPLIRLTLLLLYAALLLPLPFLAAVTQAPVPPWLLTAGAVLGAIALYGALSEQVVLTEAGIWVRYPGWINWLWRRGWQLTWDDIAALKPRSTGQGGLVYYFVSKNDHDQAYLLPMRVAGFARLVRQVEQRTGIDTQDVKPLSQPWMYLILLGFSLLLLLTDAWTITTAISLGQI
jgi:hypothetical protein